MNGSYQHTLLHLLLKPFPISQPPPTNTIVIEPVTETPKVSEIQLYQPQQHISQTPPHSQLPSSPIPPLSSIVCAPHIEIPNITTSRRSPLRDSGNQVSEDTP